MAALRRGKNPTFRGLMSKSSLQTKVSAAFLPRHSIPWDTNLDSNKPDMKRAFLSGDTKSGYQNDSRFLFYTSPRDPSCCAEKTQGTNQLSGRRRDVFTGSAAGQGKLQSLNILHVITLSAVLKWTRC